MKKQSAEVWLREGMNILAERGPEYLTIDELCRRLGMTKGSFYHHYSNRQYYLEALLTFWEREATLRLIEISQQELTPHKQLHRLTQLVTSLPEQQSETVIRAWSTQNEMVRGYQQRVDQQRLAYVQQLCAQVFPHAADREAMAQIFFLLYVGAQHLYPTINGAQLRHLYLYLQKIIEREES